MNKLTILLVFVINVFIINPILSQVDLKLILRTPMPSQLYEWKEDPSIIQIIVSNTTATEYQNTSFAFRILKDGDVVAESKYSNSSPRFNIPAMTAGLIFNGTQVLNVNSISFDRSITSRNMVPNSIPEGFYEICISIYDQYGKNITLGEEYCGNFTVLIPDPPVLISPIDNDIIRTPFPNFTWTPVTNYAGKTIKYKLKICPVYEGQSARTAIDVNPVLLEKNDIITTSYLYEPTNLPFNYFKNVNNFVWLIQAFDVNNKPIAGNQGKSEPGTFKTEDKDNSTIVLENVYPINNDTIPWIMPHLIAKYAPYNDNIKSINITLNVNKNGSKETFTNSRLIEFTNGAQQSQALNSQDLASLIICNLDNNKKFPDWMQNLEPGIKYKWSVDATFIKSDDSEQIVSSAQSSFVIGFKKPIDNCPKNDTSIKINNKIDYAFKIPLPEKLNLLEKIVLENTMFHGYNSYSDVLNKFSIELSKKTSFDSIIQNKTFEISSATKYKTGDDCNDLFNNKITKQLNAISDTGKYYYRINYLNNSGKKYFSSKAIAIKLIPDSLLTCFEMRIEDPPNNGKWTTNKKPRLSVSIKPKINKKAIISGQVRIWKKDSLTQPIIKLKKKKPLIDTTFTGNANKNIFEYTTDIAGFTKYDLNIINGETKTKTFTAEADKYYVWNFKLKFDKDSIRNDKQLCNCDTLISNDGTFKVEVSDDKKDTNPCPGNCIVDAPTNTTAGSQTLKKDSIITIGNFKIKLTEVSGSPEFLTGKGNVDVPYLRGNIKVEFTGLKVNSDNEVYEGKALAIIDEDAPYEKPDGNDFEGKALNTVFDKAKIKSIHEYSSSAGKLVSSLAATTPVSLPIGFDRDYNGYKVVIGIIAMKFTPVKAVLNATMYVELPALGPDVGLGLGAKNICFHKDGLAVKDNGILYLTKDLGYQNEGTWSFLFKSPTPTDSGTYAKWNCKGFQDLIISADVEFPRSWMKPVPDPDPSKLTKAHFKAKAEKSGNGWQWMAISNLDECELTGAEGFKMQVQEMVFDFSTVKNPEGITFPKKYKGNKSASWKGFYIKKAQIILPNKIKTFENANPSILCENIIIDKTGFTGNIFAKDIYHYPTCNLGGWQGSLDTISIDMINSSLQSGKMTGRVRISIFDTSLVYTGLIAQESNNKGLKYLLSVKPRDTMDVGCKTLKGDFYLFPTTRITIGYSEEFMAEAIISGKFSLKKKIGKIPMVDLKGIKVDGFKISTKEPHVEKGDWNFASPQHGIAGFPLSIDNIDVVSRSRDGGIGLGLQFDLNIGLKNGDNAVNGTTKLSVWGKLQSETGPQKFVYDGVELDSIGVVADMGSVRISGGLNLYNSDQTFGSGFRGIVKADFINQISVMATAQFGKVNNYEYWYVDAKAIFDEGIPIYPGLGIYGFGGGAWYHMKKSGNTNLSINASEPDSSNTPGITNSGYRYIPNKNINLGLKAMLTIGTHPKPDAFNGDVGLEAAFQNGSINDITLTGNGYFLCSPTKRKNYIVANMDLNYNIPTKTFHGTFDVDINAYPLTGNGQMVMHFDPNLWYLKIGEPSHTIHLNLADWLGADSYFMMGQNLPSPPPLPAEIQRYFPGQQESRNPSIAGGNGFAFGASAGFDTGPLKYSIFHGQFSALMGFDMALLNFGTEAHCADMEGPVGINGWYANGQIYASIAAKIGLHVDLYFTKGNYEILNMQAGAILQGAGPNPTWIKGAVDGNYRILGGKIKGHCHFEFSKGDKCKIIQENPLSKIDLISDISPSPGSKNIDVMTEPQVAMNFELNKPFDIKEMPTDNKPAKVRTFRVKLSDFNLKNKSNNNLIQGKTNIAPDNFSAYYSINEMMSPKTYYKLSASAYGEEFKDGYWHTAVKNNGTTIKQTVSTTFKTGKAPKNIRLKDVAYSYPINRQKYFLQDECNKGIVLLKTGRSNLFKEGELIAKFTTSDNDTEPIEVPFTYDSEAKALLFNIPNLVNGKTYYVKFIKKIDGAFYNFSAYTTNNSSNENNNNKNVATTKINKKILLKTQKSSMYLNEKKLAATKKITCEEVLYTMKFTTSKYNTLQAKLNSFHYITTNSYFYSNIYEEHKAVYEGDESFGYFDFNPVTWNASGKVHKFGPLVEITEYKENTLWYKNFIKPKIYDKIQWMKSKNWYYQSFMTEYAYHMYHKIPYGLINIKLDGNYAHPRTNNMAVNSSNLNIATTATTTAAITATSTTAINAAATATTTSPFSFITTITTTTSSSQNSSFTVSALSMTFSPSYFINALMVPPTPNILIEYNYGKIVPVDYKGLRARAIKVLSQAFQLRLSNSDKNKLYSIINTPYQKLYKGNYPLSFFYNGCVKVDTNPLMMSKPFIYQ